MKNSLTCMESFNTLCIVIPHFTTMLLIALYILLCRHVVCRIIHKAGSIHRVCALEERAARRMTLYQRMYIPIIFTMFGLLLGTVYYQVTDMTFLLSPFGVLSCAGGLFMFPTVYSYLYDTVKVKNRNSL